jgi:hypothetical protein
MEVAGRHPRSFPYSSPKEALDFAQIKVITNGTYLFYLVDLPLTKYETYKKIIVKPIKFNNHIIKTNYSQILINKNEIFGIQKDCKKINSVFLCNQNDIVNIKNDTCISNLVIGKKSTCNVTNNHHVPIYELLTDGVILLNNYNGNIIANGESKSIEGTF